MAAANMDGSGGLVLGLGNGGKKDWLALFVLAWTILYYLHFIKSAFLHFWSNQISISAGGGAGKSNQSIRSISPAMIPCGITDEQLVTLTVRELNKQLKMRGLNKEEMGTMKQR